ncbi:helix-turn-helix transcriptional regulator [Candidatus Enterococcus mansonii]|uniref:HTH cro/C1-type domain-containing protein n=2 Tax=Candidatus Enterococcus mansonii TaxID=1834181 RepID=A0ABU8IDQ2_9ENTE
MDVGKTIRFFRKQLNFRQKELVSKHMETSSISRIEKGEQSLKVEALVEILNTMSLTTEEFFAKCLMDDSRDKWRVLFYSCTENPKDGVAKRELLEYYEAIKTKAKARTLKELSNYFSIKLYFSRIWAEVDSITEQELDDTFNYLLAKKYYQQYDYMIINNIILLMKDDQQEYLISKIIPIKDEEFRNTEVKRYARSTLVNIITSKIYKKDFIQAKEYLSKAENFDKSSADYSFTLNIEYLKNLLGYLITGEAVYMKNIHTYIYMLEFVGDRQTLEAVKKK